MQLLPLGKQQFFDANGNPLAGGQVYFYEPATTVPRATWPSPDCDGSPNMNPVTLDSAGRAIIWGNGRYRQVVQDATGATAWDELTDAGTSSTALAAPNGSEAIGFIQDLPSPTARTVEAKLRDVVTPEDFGALGDGTDDTKALTAAINACAGKGIELLLASGKQYSVSKTLPLYSSLSIRGQGANFGGGAATTASSIIGTNPDFDVFAPPDGSPSYINAIFFSNLGIKGGKNGINLGSTGATNVVLRDVHISGQALASFAVGQWMERSIFDHCELLGGQYGFMLTNSGNASFNYIDKCLFTHCRFSGSVNGFFKDSARNCIGNTFINLVFNGCGQHAWQILGSIQCWEIINVSFETNGTSGPTLGLLTGAVTAGSNIFTISSGTGTVSDDQTVTIQGAGASGLDLTSTVVSTTATTVTLADNALTTQGAAELTNALYDEIHFGPPSSGSAFSINSITFSTALLGVAGTSDKIRYAVCNPGTTNFENVYFVKRPLYDPYMQSGLVNSAGSVRTATSWINSPYCFNSLRSADGRSRLQSVFPGNPGVGAMVALVGTGTNGTGGNYGDFSVWSKGPNRRKFFNVSGDTGAVVIGPGESGTSPNLGINISNFAGSLNALAIRNGSPPTGAVANQGFLYVSDGALFFLGGSGTVTKLADA